MIDDSRMRGAGQRRHPSGCTTSAGGSGTTSPPGLAALPFVGRVEVVGDAASLMSRLAARMPDVLLVGTQRAVDTGLTAAT